MRRSFLFVGLVLSVMAGCHSSTPSPTARVTSYRDVAPILFARCACCHRPGEAAPFSLLTYDDAHSHAGQIVEVTRSRFMPPWLPRAGHEDFANERHLTDEEINVFARWHEVGAPEGDPSDAPSHPRFTSGWQLGEPDLVLETPEFELPAAGPDRFRNFVLAVPLDEARWIRAVELRPEEPRVTHHLRLGIDTNNESVRRDAADPEPGYEGMAWGADPAGQLITWTPGMQPDPGTESTAWLLAPDTSLVLHTHLQPSGKPEGVRFRVGFYFAKAAPTDRPVVLRIGSRDIDIPPGQSEFVVSDAYTLPIDVEVRCLFPHAHSLSREILVEAEVPAGGIRTLISIPRFDENWHDTYRFAKPVQLSQGTRLVTRFTYDNSAENIRNPHQPPRRVVYGSNSADEMADVYLQVIPRNPDQRAVLAEHYERYELESKIVGYQKTLEARPDDSWSIEGLAACYVARTMPRRAIELLGSDPELLEQSSQACTILGMAHLAQQDLQAAEQQFRNVLSRDDALPVAWLGLGQVLSRGEDLNGAETAYRRVLTIAPRMTVARLDLADLLVKQERFDEAISQCKIAIAVEPNDHRPHLKLADLFAERQRYQESLEHFQKARELAAFVYSPQASLAIACYQSGDEDQANELLNEAVGLNRQDPVPHCFLGQIARRNQQWQSARSHLQQAVDLPVPDTWPASHVRQFLELAYAEQLQLAQQTEDLELLRTAATSWLKLDPDNKHVQMLLQELPQEPAVP